MSDLTEALVERAETPERRTIIDLLRRQQPELARVLPAEITPERFARVVLTELRRTPKLLECSPESLLGAMMLAAQLGLEPGPLGHVYLVPYKREVTLVIGYRGIVELAYRSGRLRSIQAATVREGDAFSYRLGSRAYLDHTPAGPPGERQPVAYYAVAQLRGGGSPFAVIYPEDVERARHRSAAKDNPLSPWTTDYDAMARKTAICRLAPLLPQTAQIGRALDVDETQPPALGDAGLLGELSDGAEA